MRKYVFGPIMSRRLGVSLGVDLVPAKTCPLDCIYCEAKSTTLLTMERKEYVSIPEVLAELDLTLKTIPMPDYITFSGAGEPTLNSGIGKVADFIKAHYPECKVCLLTNGLLLGADSMPFELASLDLIIPSLDASNEMEYQAINRPAPGETLEKLVNSLESFHRNTSMQMSLEIFIVPGINDSPESIKRFTALVKRISPNSVQLNTLDRPGAVDNLFPASPETLAAFAGALAQVTKVEMIKPLPDRQQPAPGCKLEDTIIHLKKLHTPDEEIASRCKLSTTQLNAILQRLNL